MSKSHRVLLAGLLGGLALASQSHAACSGADLLERMAATEPRRAVAIRAAAGSIVNGEGTFWRIDPGNGRRPSHLFGTVHVNDPRVIDIDAAVREAVSSASVLAVELDISRPNLQLAMFEDPGRLLLPDEARLEDLFTPREIVALKERLTAMGMPYGFVRRMQPWFLTMTLSYPPCVLQTAKSAPPLDRYLIDLARQSNASILELETIAEQLAAFADLPRDFHMAILRDMLAGPASYPNDVFETTIRAYEAQTIGLVMALSEDKMRATLGSDAKVRDFTDSLLDRRNARMAERAAPFIEDGGAFIAVGAAHLPGKGGLVQQLRARGYRVTRVE